MTTIYGYVKLKETNEPIAGVVVSVYARDMAQAPTKANTKVSDPFQLYTRSLGSAITNAQGEFRIEFDMKTSVASKAEGQPELMLAVLAPATTEAANRVAAPSPFKRLLHWTELPHLGADQSEAFVIRLLEEQLKHFDIKLPSRRLEVDDERSAARLIESEANSERLRSVLREGLAPIRSKRVTRRREIAATARRFASSLYATPKAVRSQRNFVLLRDHVETVKRNAMEDGLAKIANTAVQVRALTAVYLDKDDLTNIGLAEGPLVGEMIHIESDQLCQLLNERRGGTELARVRGLLDAHKAAAEAAARLGQEESRPTEEEETQPPEGEVEPATAIARRVLGQLRDMPLDVPMADDNLPQPLTLEELNAMLPAVQLGAGPSDQPAFHDLYHLQIAFPHVWTEAFDSELREDIEDLYRTYAEVNEENLLTDLPYVELQEKDDLLKFLGEVKNLDEATDEPVPEWATETFACTNQEWNSLSDTQKHELWNLHCEIIDPNTTPQKKQPLRNQGMNIILAAAGYKTRLARLLTQIAFRINEPYSFHHFVPNTVNFGLLLTYRQHWQPGPYQVGDLVSTIPLAPGEKRKFETKQIVKRTRAETELEKALSSKSREATTTRRADAEITENASLQSNFQMTAEGTFRFGIGEISSGTQFGVDEAQESSRVKKDFREAVLKAAQEYRQERSVEVRTTDELTTETTTSGELSNPNNELTVTYLLYELERQYTISERIHRVTPVVLVAQDVPAPNEIHESWLLTHEWILRRVLLDDSLIPALDNLSDAFAGEEVSVSVRKAVWEKQVALVTELEGTVKGLKSARGVLRERLIQAEEEISRLESMEDSQRAGSILRGIFTFGLSELAPTPGEAALAETTAMQQSVEKRLEYLEEKLHETQERFVSAEEALNEATRVYTKALETQTNRRVAIDQLRIHVKENILYYMQAIWDHEPPDQRFFRLYHVEVDLPESPTRTVGFRRATEDDIEIGLPTIEHGGVRYILEFEPPAPPDPERPNPKPLVEIADIDHPLGYKGNYIIFPLKTCLYLTNFMMREFFDDYFGVRDPDLAANFSVEELLTYTETLIREGTLTDEQRAALQTIVMTKLRQPRRDSDLVVVPTGELYMEALLGEHVLLEKFKLNHRFFDMAKARAEWREAELENLRRAARLLQEEPNLEDPDVDKRIVVEGTSEVHVEVP